MGLGTGTKFLALALTMTLAAASCSSDSDSAESSVQQRPVPIDRIELRALGVFDIDFLPDGVEFSAAGSGRWVAVHDGQLCHSVLARQTDGAAIGVDTSCVDTGEPIEAATLRWSSSGDSIFFNEDHGLVEPDINRLDIDSGSIEVLTEDGVDAVVDEDFNFDEAAFEAASFDYGAFQTSANEVYFVQQSRFLGSEDEAKLWRLDDSGTRRQVEIALDDYSPSAPLMAVGSDRFVFYSRVSGSGTESGTFMLDIPGLQVSRLPQAGMSLPKLIASAEGVVLLGSFNADSFRDEPAFVLVDVDAGLAEPVEIEGLGSPSQVLFGFVPDGSALMVVQQVSDDTFELGFYPMQDGSLGDPTILVSDAQVWAGFAPDSPLGIVAFPTLGGPTWTHDNLLLLPVSPTRVAVFDLQG